MATYQFSVTESLGIPEQITFTDESISPDMGLTERRIFIQLANGNWLDGNGVEQTVATYISWSLSLSSITLNVLTRSTAADLTVTWMTGSVVTGEYATSAAFDEFDYLFAYDLIGSETSDPSITQDNNYYSNFIQFIVNLFNGENAISVGNDIFSSQEQFNKNYVMEQNENDFF